MAVFAVHSFFILVHHLRFCLNVWILINFTAFNFDLATTTTTLYPLISLPFPLFLEFLYLILQFLHVLDFMLPWLFLLWSPTFYLGSGSVGCTLHVLCHFEPKYIQLYMEMFCWWHTIFQTRQMTIEVGMYISGQWTFSEVFPYCLVHSNFSELQTAFLQLSFASSWLLTTWFRIVGTSKWWCKWLFLVVCQLPTCEQERSAFQIWETSMTLGAICVLAAQAYSKQQTRLDWIGSGNSHPTTANMRSLNVGSPERVNISLNSAKKLNS